MAEVVVTANSGGLAQMQAGEVTANIGTYMSTMDALLFSLGSCSAMTLHLYSERKGWPLKDVSVRLTYERPDANGPHKIVQHVTLVGDLDDEQRERLRLIAGRCPIHKVLEGPTEFDEVLVAEEGASNAEVSTS